MVELSAVQNLLASWWFEYDQGNFDAWGPYFARDARFVCRSDTGDTEFEDFFRADLHGHEAVLAWQVDHRRNSPYPLRHNCTNVHLTSVDADAADFRSYLFVTQVVDGAVSNLSTGLCLGSVRDEDGQLRIAELRVVLDFMSSEVFDAAARAQPV
jgi:hypothetical protein